MTCILLIPEAKFWQFPQLFPRVPSVFVWFPSVFSFSKKRKPQRFFGSFTRNSYHCQVLCKCVCLITSLKITIRKPFQSIILLCNRADFVMEPFTDEVFFTTVSLKARAFTMMTWKNPSVFSKRTFLVSRGDRRRWQLCKWRECFEDIEWGHIISWPLDWTATKDVVLTRSLFQKRTIQQECNMLVLKTGVEKALNREY